MANTPRIWDYLSAITYTKDKSVLNDENFAKEYKPFLINRMLSQHRDTVLAANMVNQRPALQPLLFEPFRVQGQFLFLLNTIRARFRKNEKSVKYTDPDDVDAIAEYYGCSRKQARDLVSIHSSDQMTIIYRRLEKGGITHKGRRHDPKSP